MWYIYVNIYVVFIKLRKFRTELRFRASGSFSDTGSIQTQHYLAF